MKRRNINSVLKNVLERIEPPKEELKIIEKSLEEFQRKINKNLKTLKINAEVFVGGSFAKGTVIKKDYYDIDIFIRFDKKHKNISELAKKILEGIKNFSMIHGSRDYFRIKIRPTFFLEVIPVLKIKNPKEAENITDLSYSHVRYIRKKIKSKKILDEIRITKAFCYANNCYGAESYINGFSGYSLELLIYYYKSFSRFIRAMIKFRDKKTIDIEKHYKNKQQILMDINASKLQSPIILIDPTYKQRNALAALSRETFEKFQEDCRKFLRNPSIKSFEIKKVNIEKIKQYAKRKKYEFILLEAKTNKQEGDIAGSKLLKFYKYLGSGIEKFFDIKDKGFDYGGKKSARYFFVVKRKKEILIKGPLLKQEKHSKRFKSKYKKVNIRGGKLYARIRITHNLKKFLNDWKKKNKRRIKEMYITNLKTR